MPITNPDDRRIQNMDDVVTNGSAEVAVVADDEQYPPTVRTEDYGEDPHAYPPAGAEPGGGHDCEAPDGEPHAPEGTAVPVDRISKWESKLLNLSFHNPMLGFRTASAVRFICADLNNAIRLLVEHQEVEARPLPTSQESMSSAAFYCLGKVQVRERADNGDEAVEGETDEQRHKRVQSYLRARLATLNRNARFALSETGNNTLYLVAGLVRWTPARPASEARLSPLGLLSVGIVGTAPNQRLKIIHPRLMINPTLMTRFFSEFGFESTMETMDLESDQGDIVEVMREKILARLPAVADAELVEELALSSLSFSEQVILRDIQAMKEVISENKLLAEIITPAGKKRGELVLADGADGSIEKRLSPIEVTCPLEADPSQLVAIVNAMQGKSFVLQGPPGTGKSQTIANILGKSAEAGKRVLFVAQKQAALDVVQNQLEAIGLNDFVLALHSNKIARRDFQQQLKAILRKDGPCDDSFYEQDLERLTEYRDRLDHYAEALHKRQTNDVTAHHAFGASLGYTPQEGEYRFEPQAVLDATPESLQALHSELDAYALSLSRIKGMDEKVLSLITPESFSMGWQQDLENALYSVQRRMTDLFARIKALDEWLGVEHLDRDGQTADRLEALRELGTLASEAKCVEVEFARGDHPQGSCRYLRSAQGVIERIQQFRGTLSCKYRRNVELELVELRDRYQQIGELSAWRRVLERLKMQYALWKVARGLAWPRRVEKDIGTLLTIQRLNEQLGEVPEAVRTSEMWDGESTDLAQMTLVLNHYEKVRHLASRLRGGGDQSDGTEGVFSAFMLSERRAVVRFEELGVLFEKLDQSLHEVADAISHLKSLDASEGRNLAIDPLDPAKFRKSVDSLIHNLNQLRVWHKYSKQFDPKKPEPIQDLCDSIRSGSMTVKEAHKALDSAIGRAMAIGLLAEGDEFDAFVDAPAHRALIEEFSELTEKVGRGCKERIRARQLARISEMRESNTSEESEEDDETGWQILNRQLDAGSRSGRSLSIRLLFERCTEQILGLTPIMLMSPLSVAQYLPRQKEMFDLVIFDEASQLRMEECVGAIVRAKQVVIVGDSKQLPPTNFFRQSITADEEEPVSSDEVEETIQSDQESLLEDAEVSGLAQCMLQWHYRSRHESLIAFSNMQYYDNQLLTFPSPNQDPAVKFHYVEKGVYGRGGNRRNQPEAEAVVKKLVEIVDTLVESGDTVGIVTLNNEQRQLIEQLIEKRIGLLPSDGPKREALKQIMSEEYQQPLFVKNLENVQGDERDVILLSIGYGPDVNGDMTLNFGPINQLHGPKRLNVAITRARKKMHLFSSFRSRRLKEASPNRSMQPGLVDLAQYLEYADTGNLPAPNTDASESRGAPESVFEEEVLAALERKNWRTVPQVGVGRYRIDIGVIDPRDPSRYLAGVECDGATYHSGYTARIRDKCREDRLREQGWEILRVWSQDWWQNSELAMNRLVGELSAILEQAEEVEPNDEVDEEDVVEGKGLLVD